MKRNRSFGIVVAFGLCLLTSSAHAADLLWNNGAATGNWNLTDLNWTGSAWSNNPANNAIFNNRNETINVASGISGGILRMHNSGRQWGNHILTLSGGTLDFASLDIHGNGLGGNVDGLGEANNQRLVLNNVTANFSGDATVRRGSLWIQGNSNVTVNGAINGIGNWSNLLLQNTATLTVTGGINFNPAASNIDLNGGTLRTTSIWGNTYGGTTRLNFNGTTVVALGDNADFVRMSNEFDVAAHTGVANVAAGGFRMDTNGKNVGITNTLGGVGGVTKLGAGTLTLSGGNTYSGGTTIQQGTLNITSNGALGATPGAPATSVTFSGNSTLQAGAPAVATAVNRNFAINSGVTATFDTNGNTMYIGGVIGGAAAAGIHKAGAGTLLLGGANTYAGDTTISGGTLRLGNPTASSVPTLLNGNFDAPLTGLADNSYRYYDPVGNPAVEMTALQRAEWQWVGGIAIKNSNDWGYTRPYPSADQASSLQGTRSITQTLNFTEPGFYTISWFDARRSNQLNPYNLLIDGVVVGSFIPSGNAWNAVSTGFFIGTAGNHTLTFAGTATVGDNSVAIDSIVLGGLNTTGSLPSTTNVNITSATGALDIASLNQTIASLSGVAGSSVLLGSGTLTVNPASGATDFAGVISGTGGVTKSGAGTQVFSGDNNYAGPTTISGGELIIDGNVAGGGAYNVNAGRLGGNGTVDVGASAVNVAATGALSPGNAGYFPSVTPPSGSSATGLSYSAGLDVNTVGTLSILGDVELDGTLLIDVFGPLDADLLDIAGNFEIGAGAQLEINGETDFTQLDFKAFGFEVGDRVELISAAGISGSFANALFNETFTDAGNNRLVLGNDGASIFLAMMAVPEPGTSLLWVTLGVALVGISTAMHQRNLRGRRHH